ncbi:MAG: T9SS type A sorting domain-containing protein [Bacteroidales bacterium]|nr:T9SS type A sorting domain-containing protein [Bacteroidales bacterium]
MKDNSDYYSIFPNPIRDKGTITFKMDAGSKVSLLIYDVNGKLVYSIINDKQFDSGTYSYDINTSILSDGIYYSKLKQGDSKIVIRKILVIK